MCHATSPCNNVCLYMLYICTFVTVISKFSINFICLQFHTSTIDSRLQDEYRSGVHGSSVSSRMCWLHTFKHQTSINLCIMWYTFLSNVGHKIMGFFASSACCAQYGVWKRRNGLYFRIHTHGTCDGLIHRTDLHTAFMYFIKLEVKFSSYYCVHGQR